MVIVVMGAPGAGKSTVGKALAADLGWLFVDSDAGRTSLGDLRAVMMRAADRREHVVIAYAALKADERDALRGDLRTIRFVYLKASRQLLETRQERLGKRSDAHAALHRQLLELEEPGDTALTLDAGQDVSILVPTIRRELGL
jgi:gluconokinase